MALRVLRDYALKGPSLPPSILLSHTATSITVFDCFPKSIFHFLILPRLPHKDIPDAKLNTLRDLLTYDKNHARAVLDGLAADAKDLRKSIEEEMISRYGFKWDIWTGFHAVPSMQHVHLHVLSADLVSTCMKKKKHYNSFHPKVGFFIPLDEVISWLDADDNHFKTMSSLKPKPYEELLKQPLACFHCRTEFGNMPKLKAHLQEEFDTLAKREKSRQARRAQVEERLAAKRAQDDEVTQGDAKRQRTAELGETDSEHAVS